MIKTPFNLMNNIIVSILLFGLATAGWLHGQNVPGLINYQGVLVNAAGVPLPPVNTK